MKLFCLLIVAVSFGGCGSTGANDDGRKAETAALAARWASAQADVAMFAVHCEDVARGERGARSRVLREEVGWMVAAAADSTTTYQERYASNELAKAAVALSCEPKLAARLTSAASPSP